MAEQDNDYTLVLYDGDCGLCQRTVTFVLARDPRARFRFAALSSQAAQRALAAAGFDGDLPDSVVCVRGGRVQVKSAASLAIARGLRWPWPLLSICWLVPYPLRDLVYDWIARNRQRWFQRPASCLLPTPELRARFLDADEVRKA